MLIQMHIPNDKNSEKIKKGTGKRKKKERKGRRKKRGRRKKERGDYRGASSILWPTTS